MPVSREAFARLYETNRKRAVEVAMSVTRDRATADDAVQTAACYFLARLDGYARITPSLFFQVVALRAKHLVESERGSARRPRREFAAGSGSDLEAIEQAAMPDTGGKTKPHPRCD